MSSVEMFMSVRKNWPINYYERFEQFNSVAVIVGAV